MLEDLTTYLVDADVDVVLSSLDAVLDSDGDGARDLDDVCPYVFDPDQTPGPYGFGAACDFRMQTLSTSGGYGCGLLLDGAVVCWHEEGEPYGGLPPAPTASPVTSTVRGAKTSPARSPTPTPMWS